MPELKCTVQTCTHNHQFLCDLDQIQVGGDAAKTAGETCCDSFQERKEGSYMNMAEDISAKKPSDTASIDCKAEECKYNKDCDCHAGKISVEGSTACHCSGTECATFCCR